MSQLLKRLEVKLNESKDPIAIGELKVRKACYLARTGYFDESKRLIAELRLDFGSGQHARISTWIMLAEGLVEFFTCPGYAAKDRIARSELIAVAVGDAELAAIACAWKALVEFEFSNFDAMALSMRRAFDFATPENHEAQSRIAIILSDCFYLCGDRESGQFWFMTSREHALRDGDQATIDALLYSKAAFSTASLRAQRCFGSLDRDQVELVRLEVASSFNFQQLAEILSVNHLIMLSRARILLLLEDFKSAYSALSDIRGRGPFASYNFDLAIIDLEMAYCLFKQGLAVEGQALLDNTSLLKFEAVDIDERLVYCWLRRELHGLGAILADGYKCDEDFERVAGEYKIYRERLRNLADDLANEWLRKIRLNNSSRV